MEEDTTRSTVAPDEETPRGSVPARAEAPGETTSATGTAESAEQERGDEVVGPGGMTRSELEEAYEETLKDFDDGDVLTGQVMRIDKDEVLVDVGYKSEGVIPVRELSIRHDADPTDEVEIGETIDALVLQKEDKEGRLVLSKKRAVYEKSWGRIEELKEQEEPVIGTVIEVVKGGLILDIGLRGFLPASLVDIRRVGDLHPFVGEELKCRIIELDRNRNNVVLSRRAWLEETQAETRLELLSSLKKGEIRTGTVSSIVKFGAFVDLGGIDGLVHVSELSWKHVEDPGEVVEVGEEVEVEVLDVDTDRERISLSLKSTQEDPWEQFARRYAPGDVIEGKVTKLVSFGAFVAVGEGLEGLVHISELSQRHVQTPAEVVAVGDKANVKILDIDPRRRRVSLSIKQVDEPDPGHETGPLRQDAFLELEDIEVEPEPEPEPETQRVDEEPEAQEPEAQAPEAEAPAEPEAPDEEPEAEADVAASAEEPTEAAAEDETEAAPPEPEETPEAEAPAEEPTEEKAEGEAGTEGAEATSEDDTTDEDEKPKAEPPADTLEAIVRDMQQG